MKQTLDFEPSKLITVFFCIIIGIIFSIHLSTITISPIPWLDEVHIIEMGRHSMLDSKPQWSLMVPNEGECFWVPFYFGGMMQDFMFKVTQSQFGPRFMTLLGFMVTAFLLAKILIIKGVKPSHAYVVALIFFVDPIMTQNIRGNRVDIWTFVCTLLSVVLISQSESICKNFKEEALLCFTVGCLSILQLFIWPSSLLLLPIVAFEIFTLLAKKKWDTKTTVRWVVWGASGALLTLAVLLMPLLEHWSDVVNYSLKLPSAHLNVDISKNFNSFISILLKSPFISILFLLSVIIVKSARRYFPMFLLCAIFIVLTRCYIHRFIYLLPYIMLSMGLAFTDANWACRRRYKRVFHVLALSAVVWGVFYSVLARNIGEAFFEPIRNVKHLETVLLQEIGGVGTAIYIDTFQTYYVGRRLGWKQYRMLSGEWWADGNAIDVLSKCDLFLTEKTLNTEEEEFLRNRGYDFKKQIIIPCNTDERIIKLMHKHGRTIGYGSYILYSKNKELKQLLL